MKRMLCAVLALCMVLSLCPLPAYAAETVANGTCGESYSGVEAYSFEQYIYKNVNKEDAKPAMVELAQRLFYYERAAKAALG